MLRSLIALVVGIGLWLSAWSANAAALTCPSSINGQVVSPGDPKQKGRLNRGTPPSACGVQDVAPAVISPGANFTHDAHTFKNRTNGTCMTVTLTSNDDLSAAAYLDAFAPADIQANYLGDSGNRTFPGTPRTFSFDVPSLSDFVVVVTEGVDGAGGNYNLSVSGCGQVLVTRVNPDFGPTAGNTAVTIKGAGFLSVPGLPTVRFGGALATAVVVGDEFTLTAKTPAHAAGLVDVEVRNANNSNDTLIGGFTYYAPIAPTVSLSSDVNPSAFGQSVTFTAHVDPTAPGAATGTITFRDNGSAIGTGVLNGAGDATFSTTLLGVGNHPMTAFYPGDALFLAGTSNPLTQTVGPASSTTTLISSSNPSIVNQTVTFTATVAAQAPGAGTPSSGTVTFTDGATVLGTVAVATGQAELTIATLTVGTHPIVGTYSGDAQFNASTSDPALAQVVKLTGATVLLTSSLNPSTLGANVTFSAKVTSTAGIPTGTVTFSDTGLAIGGPVALSAAGVATFSTATLTIGTHAITATYSGDATNEQAAAAVSQIVKPAVEDAGVDSGADASPTDAALEASNPDSGRPGTVDSGRQPAAETPSTDDSGCGCRSAGSTSVAGSMLTWLGVVAFLVRRRRERRTP